ncbi:MAG: CCA tRNA nucleotidyltransferase [Candidatus Aminicenantes bacterium]|nr:CCA tRNA nucleotidyltransferase [Candidatus Aminicenantes bacterium]
MRDLSKSKRGKPVILQEQEHKISRKDIDRDALTVINRLKRQGFTAYLTGAAVQNLMNGDSPKDFDIVTDARPGQIKRRFSNTYLIGRRFRLAHIHFNNGKYIEVATFRRESNPSDKDIHETVGKWKETYGSPREDAFRRDITINALFYDVSTASVIDYVGGLKDLSKKKIRIIGDPAIRYTEDPVRMIRVVRHAARLGFNIERKTKRAIQTHLNLISNCPGARLFEELNKDLNFDSRLVFESYLHYGILKPLLGQMGEDYETQGHLTSKLLNLLEAKDKGKSLGFHFSQEELYSLLIWPWAERLLADKKENIQKILDEATALTFSKINFPKKLRSDCVHIMYLLSKLFQAFRTGYIPESWRRRPHFTEACRLCFLIEKGRTPRPEESFNSFFRKTSRLYRAENKRP